MNCVKFHYNVQVLASTGDPQINTKVELFRRHSQRLGEVAKQAAEGTSDNKRESAVDEKHNRIRLGA